MSDDNDDGSYDPIREYATRLHDSGVLHNGPRASWDSTSWLTEHMEQLGSINSVLLTGAPTTSAHGFSSDVVESRFRDADRFWFAISTIRDVHRPDRSLLAQPAMVTAAALIYHKFMWEAALDAPMDQRRAAAREWMEGLARVDFRHRDDSPFLIRDEGAPTDEEILAHGHGEALPARWRDLLIVKWEGGRIVIATDRYSVLALAVLLRYAVAVAVAERGGE